MPKGQFGRPPLAWSPLPYMDEYLNELLAQLRDGDYIRKVKMGLSHFNTFCAEEDITHPEQIERHHLVKFQGWVNRHQEWSKTHQIQILKYVRGWCRWISEDAGHIDANPWARIRVGTVPKQPNPISDEQMTLLFEAHRRSMFSSSPFIFHRREIILTLLYGWGLRIHELQSLNVANMDIRLEYVTCRNKGGTQKHLPYPPIMKQVVQRWLPVRGSKAVLGEDALIIDAHGKRLDLNQIRRVIVDLGKQAGMDIHPHMLRDTFGTHMLDSDVPVERVSKVMGHTNVAQTRSYARVNDHKVAESHDQAMTPRLDELIFGRTSERKPA